MSTLRLRTLAVKQFLLDLATLGALYRKYQEASSIATFDQWLKRNGVEGRYLELVQSEWNKDLWTRKSISLRFELPDTPLTAKFVDWAAGTLQFEYLGKREGRHEVDSVDLEWTDLRRFVRSKAGEYFLSDPYDFADETAISAATEVVRQARELMRTISFLEKTEAKKWEAVARAIKRRLGNKDVAEEAGAHPLSDDVRERLRAAFNPPGR